MKKKKQKLKFRKGQSVYYVGRQRPNLKNKRGTVISTYPDDFSYPYTVDFNGTYYCCQGSELSGSLTTGTSWMQETI